MIYRLSINHLHFCNFIFPKIYIFEIVHSCLVQRLYIIDYGLICIRPYFWFVLSTVKKLQSNSRSRRERELLSDKWSKRVYRNNLCTKIICQSEMTAIIFAGITTHVCTYTNGHYNKFHPSLMLVVSPSNNPFFESHSICENVYTRRRRAAWTAGTLHIDDLLYHNGLAYRVVR